MTGGLHQATKHERGPAIVFTALAGLLVLVSMSCHHADQPAVPVQVNSARRGQANSGAGPVTTPASSVAARPVAGFVSSILDPRMGPLLSAAEHWRLSAGPERTVLDQVYLVPDLDRFLEVIATWDEHAFFPILIDDPAWTLPFLRAFHPATRGAGRRWVQRRCLRRRSSWGCGRPRCPLGGRATSGGPGVDR